MQGRVLPSYRDSRFPLPSRIEPASDHRIRSYSVLNS
jgi:hypothetical protein